jgi:hypothetical protein
LKRGKRSEPISKRERGGGSGILVCCRLSPCSILEEDTAVGGAIFGTDTLLSGRAIRAWWSFVSGRTIVAGRASWAGRSFGSSGAGASVRAWSAILTGWSRCSVFAGWAGVSGSGRGTLSVGSSGSLLSVFASRAGWSVRSGWSGWACTSILARGAGVAVRSGCAGFAGRASGAGWSSGARFARWWSDRSANLQRRATGETGRAGWSGTTGFTVFTGFSRRAWKAGQAAVLASWCLPLGDGPVARHLVDADGLEVADFLHDFLGGSFAKLGFFANHILDVRDIVVDHR